MRICVELVVLAREAHVLRPDLSEKLDTPFAVRLAAEELLTCLDAATKRGVISDDEYERIYTGMPMSFLASGCMNQMGWTNTPPLELD
jgi:hypothetical protein